VCVVCMCVFFFFGLPAVFLDDGKLSRCLQYAAAMGNVYEISRVCFASMGKCENLLLPHALVRVVCVFGQVFWG
jgi:hypothetical protein